ncbi:MAG: hypothetical protein DRQ88_00935 [Epsilonproteobacteria bacterium]|nr:MAG: hypothetical protein DRQ89_10095 [Campylobacterota bacterium]RLA67859.1 MAG: hypothetical protein DRQ88_00935 [Campylobacterota bacterium]
MIFKILAFFLIFQTAQARQFIFDQSLEQVYSPFDTGFSGLSQFYKNLKNWAPLVSVNSRPLDKLLYDLDGPGNILFLGVAMNQKYNQQILKALDDFLKRGGGVLVSVEHDDLFKNAQFQNSFIQKYGITAVKEKAVAKENSWRDSIWPLCYSPFFKLEDVRVYLPAPLNIEGDAKPLLYLKNPYKKEYNLVGAYKKVGKGILVVLGDVEIFWNMNPDTGVRAGKNLIFIKKLVNLLAPESNKKSYPKFKKILSNKKKVLFYQSGKGSGPDVSLSGLSKFARYLNIQGYNIEIKSEVQDFLQYDLVVISTPLETVKNIPKLVKAKKILLISDGMSNILSYHLDFTKILKNDLGLSFSTSDYANPANGILKYWGHKFFKGSLISRERNHFFSTKGAIYRATFVEKTDKGPTGKSLWSVSPKVVSPMNSFVPASDDGSNGEPFKLNLNQQYKEDFPVAMYWNNLLALGDLEILSNQFFGKTQSGQFLSKFSNWLKNSL